MDDEPLDLEMTAEQYYDLIETMITEIFEEAKVEVTDEINSMLDSLDLTLRSALGLTS
jgi:hypothetical protein